MLVLINVGAHRQLHPIFVQVVFLVTITILIPALFAAPIVTIALHRVLVQLVSRPMVCCLENASVVQKVTVQIAIIMLTYAIVVKINLVSIHQKLSPIIIAIHVFSPTVISAV